MQAKKVLYAHNYYPKEEFWQLYDLPWYLELRKKFHADQAFPDIYEKTYVSKKYKRMFWKGLYRVILHRSPFRLLNAKSEAKPVVKSNL
jgi:hypothetical protein